MNDERWDSVDAFVCEALVPEAREFAFALEASDAAGLPAINVAPNQGKFLHLLARVRGARRILEIGTLGGYSTLWLARALPPEGELISLELDPAHAKVARANLAAAGFGARAEVRVGPALESLARLRAEDAAPFDFTFIDADKANAPEYFAHALELSTLGAVIVVDNAIRGGAILDPAGDANARGMRRFYELLAGHPRVSATALQTVGSKGYDGFALALVVA